MQRLLVSLALLLNAALALGENSWPNGLSQDETYFPIAVWLQSPRNAARFKAAGINLYVGLWNGPTADQLAELEKAGVR
jgi:hypothetical protein